MSKQIIVECTDTIGEQIIKEWQEFHAETRHSHPSQFWYASKVEASLGKKILFVTGRGPNREVLATALVELTPHRVIRNAWSNAFCRSGPVCDNVDVFIHFLQGMVRLPELSRVGRLRITPYWLDEEGKELTRALTDNGWRDSELFAFRSTGLIRLDRTADEIVSSFSKSARRQIRRAQAREVTIRPIQTEEEALEFLESLNNLFDRKELGRIVDKRIMGNFREFNMERRSGVIVGAFHDDQYLSGLQLLCDSRTAHAEFFASNYERLHKLGNLRIAPSLYLGGMLLVRGFGCQVLDLGGWKADVDPDDRMYSIYKYKSELAPAPAVRLREHSYALNPLINMVSNPKQKLQFQANKILRGRK